MHSKEIFGILKEAGSEWIEDHAPTLGAALAYYTVFSLAPLLIIIIGVAGLVFGPEAAQGQIFEQLRGLLGEAGAKSMQDLVENANAKPATGIFATVIGIVTLLFGASGVFGQLQTSLNAIWGVQPKPGRGVLGIIQDRILSFGFILVVGFLLLVSLLLTAAIALVGEWSGGMMPGMEFLIQLLNSVLSLAVITLALRHAIQVPARRQDRVARCLDRRLHYRGALHSGEVCAGSLSWEEQRELFVWCCGLTYCLAFMGLLFLADPFFRSGGHAGLRESIRLARGSRRQCGRRAKTVNRHRKCPVKPKFGSVAAGCCGEGGQ